MEVEKANVGGRPSRGNGVFFFSSRRRHTRLQGDWSSDVCSSDLPGDWRQWRMAAGTRSAQTLLDHVTIEYGSGVVIESASPSINNTAFNHHSGPAIGVDLASSPAGKGNSAKGNSLNAIAVPSGPIRSQVIWGMVGIPYLVQQGLIQIDRKSTRLNSSHLVISYAVFCLKKKKNTCVQCCLHLIRQSRAS